MKFSAWSRGRCRQIILLVLLTGLLLSSLKGQGVNGLSGRTFPPVPIERDSALAPREDEDAIRERQKWFVEQRSYPSGVFPADARFKAFDYMKRKMGYDPAESRIALDGSGFWTSIGPNNIAGRMLSIAIHPTNPSILYAGSADGGVWRSLNGGTTWAPLSDTLPSSAISALVIDPTNPDTIYAGTGEGAFNFDAAVGVGVLKSTDQGASWSAGPLFDRYINALAIHPTNTQVLYAASRSGVFKSTDGNATWSLVLAGNAAALVLDPNAPDTLYAALWGNPATRADGGIYRSTNGGANWTLLQNGLPPQGQIGRVALAMAPSATRTLYAGIGTAFAGPLQGVYRTDDGGDSWTLVFDSPAYCQSQCWYDNVLAVDPRNPNAVFSAGIIFYKSTDGGRAWSPLGSNVHVDHHALVFSPADPRTVYAATDGGLYRSADEGLNWISLNNGLVTTQFYALGLSRSDPTIALGGTQDNGTLKQNLGGFWSRVLGGDGGFVAVDPNDPKVIYAESQNFNFAKSTDGGLTWRFAGSGVSAAENRLFITPFVMDPRDSRTLYTGTIRLYKTSDGANRWTAISDNLSRLGGPVSAIAVAPSATQTIYVGTADGYVWRTDSGGNNWQLVINGLPNRYVTRLRVHPANPAVAYVTFSGTGSGHVYKTVDSGANWQNISSNLPDLPVNALVIDPSSPGMLYIGTDLGVFQSVNDGGSWVPFNNGFPNVIVNDLEFFGNGNLLRAATHGRGMFQMLTPTGRAANIRALSGSPQAVAVSSAFAAPLVAVATDGDNNPVTNTSVTFSAPTSGAGGTFTGGSTTATVLTDMNGVAVAPPFAANGTAGSYEVVAGIDGTTATARFPLGNVTSAVPTIRSLSPTRAIAGQLITIEGTNFGASPSVMFVQQGNQFPLASFDIAPLAPTVILAFVADDLVAGPCTVVVSTNAGQSAPFAFQIDPAPTPPIALGTSPIRPSPGQRFVLILDGQLPGLEKMTVTQGSTTYNVPIDGIYFGAVSATLPEALQPGAATISVANENSPPSAPLTINIPTAPTAATLVGLSRTSAVVGQPIAISAGDFSFAAKASRNVVLFSQSGQTIESPTIDFSGSALVAAVPEGLSSGAARVSVKSIFPNGEATAAFSPPRDLQIVAAPAAPFLSRLAPGVSTPNTIVSSASAPGGVVRLVATQIGAFNPAPAGNTVLFGAAPGRTVWVDPRGNQLDVEVPDGLPPGPVSVSVSTRFGGVDSPPSNPLTLLVAARVASGGLQPGSQTLTINTISPARFSVQWTDAGSQPLRGRTVFFVAPPSGPSGAFATTGGSTLGTAVTDNNGIAVSPPFRSNGRLGTYKVTAFIPGLNAKAEFTVANASLPAAAFPVNMAARGVQVYQTATSPETIQVGYASMTVAQPPSPAGVAVFGWKPADALLTEAGVGAATPTRSALIFVDTRGTINTGVALVNPNDQPVTVSWSLFDTEGRLLQRAADRTLAARAQAALFVTDPTLFGSVANNIVGTLAIESSLPIASITLRLTANERGELIFTTLPVADATAVASGGSVVIPHLAVGGSFSSQVILLNPQATPLRGRISFFRQDGTPLSEIGGGAVQSYTIPSRGAFFLNASGGSDLRVGFAVVEPEMGSSAPVGSLVYRYFALGVLITESGVGTTVPTRDSLIFAESTSAVATGFALANPGDAAATITLNLYAPDGGRLATASRTLPPHSQMAVFADQLSPRARDLRGTLHISSTVPLAGVTLRATTNERGELILTTLPVSNLSSPGAGRTVLFPHLAYGGGFAMQLIVLSGGPEAAGQLSLYSQEGQPLTLSVK